MKHRKGDSALFRARVAIPWGSAREADRAEAAFWLDLAKEFLRWSAL